MKGLRPQWGWRALGDLLVRALAADTFSEPLRALDATPTLAIDEDAHWADAATIDLLRFLTRRIRARRLRSRGHGARAVPARG